MSLLQGPLLLPLLLLLLLLLLLPLLPLLGACLCQPVS
jgi:hypothetical protein